MFQEEDFDDCLNVSGDLNYEDLEDGIDSDVDVEVLVKAISKCRKEVDFLKKLKKNRTLPIDEKIERLNNNEERLNNSDMAELIVIDIKPFRNAPELKGLENAEVIIDPYKGLDSCINYEGCDEYEIDVYEY